MIPSPQKPAAATGGSDGRSGMQATAIAMAPPAATHAATTTAAAFPFN
jgi:hypothetical protein